MMKAGIDFRPALTGRAGIGRAAGELARALAAALRDGEELALFGVALRRPLRLGEGFQWIFRSPRVRPALARFPARLLHLLGRFGWMGVETFTGPLDLFLDADFVYPPLKAAGRVPFLYDLLFLREGADYHSEAFCDRMGRRVRAALSEARGVLVPSQAVARDLDRYFPGLAIPRRIVPLGGDHLLRVTARPAPLERPFFFSLGTFEPRKNHRTLLAAFAVFGRVHDGIDLVIAGARGWMDEPVLEDIARHPLRARIRVIHDADDGLIAGCFRRALALVYPSLEEGFGLPVAEALALGCPVITSSCSAISEVAQGAALLVDPKDAGALASALSAAASDPSLRLELARKGKERAKSLTWSRSAESILAFFRELISAGPSPPGAGAERS